MLDFGLAKAMEPAAAGSADAMQSPTLTDRATQVGVILGTAAYMAPEQARGKAVDKRADIWAFGLVVYEMLTGRRAFAGEEISDVLAAVLRQDIEWAALPADVPAPVQKLLRRCLERDPRKRLRDIGEARLLLEDPAATAPASPRHPRRSPHRVRRCRPGGVPCHGRWPACWRRRLRWRCSVGALAPAAHRHRHRDECSPASAPTPGCR